MPLDTDRIAGALLEGCKALIAKDMAPLHAALAASEARSAALEARLASIEARPDPDVAGAVEGAVEPLRVAMAQGEEVRAAIEARLAEQEARSAAVRPVEPPSLPDVPALVAEAVKAAVDALPKPQDGKDADPSEIVALRDELADVKAAIPEPVELPDLSGFATKAEVAEVRDSIPVVVEPKDFTAEIEAVRAAIPDAPDLSGFAMKADIPEPKDFTAEIAGITARLDALRMPEVINGKDGVGIADVKLNADREVIVKYTDGETKNLGNFDGRDGFGLEQFDVDYDGERTLKFGFRGEGRTAEHSVSVPLVIDRGIWKDGKTYERGDALTYGGDFWIAQGETGSRPGTDKTWRLAVRKGRDAKSDPVKR